MIYTILFYPHGWTCVTILLLVSMDLYVFLIPVLIPDLHLFQFREESHIDSGETCSPHKKDTEEGSSFYQQK